MDFPAPSEACAPTLDKILAAHPYAAHVFMYSPETGMVFRSQSDRLKERCVISRARPTTLNKMYDGWLKMDFKDMTEKLAHSEKKGIALHFRGGMGAARRQASVPVRRNLSNEGFEDRESPRSAA